MFCKRCLGIYPACTRRPVIFIVIVLNQWYVFFIETDIFHLFLVTTFRFWLALNNHKKSMGNCISKANKDHFFLFWRGDEIYNFFWKRNGKAWSWHGYRWDIMKLYSMKKYSYTLAPLQTAVWWGNLFLSGLGV